MSLSYVNHLNEYEANAVREALNLLASKMKSGDLALNSPDVASDYCCLHIGTSEEEKFLCLYLNSQNELIDSEVLFSGTVNAASVYPRVIAKRALLCNATSIIISHNHPSGRLEPSSADRAITQKIKDGLALLDIGLLDHLIVSGNSHYSFAAHGLL